MKSVLHNRPQKWMTPRGARPWGIQIGLFAVRETHICKIDFHFFNRSYVAFPFSSIQWKEHSAIIDPKSEWHLEVQDPGVFKLDHFHSKKHISAKLISTFLTGHMQHSISLHPEKRALHHNRPQKWMSPRGARPWSIQIGPFAIHKNYFCKRNFHFFNKPNAAFLFSCIQ